jgi:hypothetical protein
MLISCQGKFHAMMNCEIIILQHFSCRRLSPSAARRFKMIIQRKIT